MNSLPVSIVVPTLNEGRALAETIASIREAATSPVDVIIVDDGSTDGCCGDLRGLSSTTGPKISVVSQPRGGVAAARNAGARLATQPIVVFLDAHCWVHPDWLGPLVDCLEKRPHSACGPAMSDPRDPDYVGCGARIVDHRLRYRWEPVRGSSPVEVGVIPGGCMAIARGLFDDLGRFDAMKEFGCEDVEFCFRAWRYGVSLYGVSTSRVEHRFRQSPPFAVRSTSRIYNAIRTALLHMEGSLLQTTLTTLSTEPGFAGELVAALGSDCLARRTAIDEASTRSLAEYFARFTSLADD